MTIPKSNLLKKITLDMPIKEDYCVVNEVTVGDFLNALGIVPALTFIHDGIEYYVDRWGENEVCIQVNNSEVKNCPTYIQLFNDKKDNFIQLVQYGRFLDGTYFYEKLIDWKKVKHYETFKPGWLK